jgi:hypothetical protein
MKKPSKCYTCYGTHVIMIAHGPFRPQIKTFLGDDLCVVAFSNHIDAPMCIHVEECPTFEDSWLIVLIVWH